MKWIAETLKKLTDVQVQVVHPNEVKWSTASRGKTDRVDAKKLAELGRTGLLPRAVHVVRIHHHGVKPLQQVFARIARRRDRQIAIVALART